LARRRKANEGSSISEGGASIGAALMAACEFGIHHETQSNRVFATISVDVAKISKATLEAELVGGA
jgi:hypothetical protein